MLGKIFNSWQCPGGQVVSDHEDTDLNPAKAEIQLMTV